MNNSGFLTAERDFTQTSMITAVKGVPFKLGWGGRGLGWPEAEQCPHAQPQLAVVVYYEQL